jgi:hypothetical protein
MLTYARKATRTRHGRHGATAPRATSSISAGYARPGICDPAVVWADGCLACSEWLNLRPVLVAVHFPQPHALLPRSTRRHSRLTRGLQAPAHFGWRSGRTTLRLPTRRQWDWNGFRGGRLRSRCRGHAIQAGPSWPRGRMERRPPARRRSLPDWQVDKGCSRALSNLTDREGDVGV